MDTDERERDEERVRVKGRQFLRCRERQTLRGREDKERLRDKKKKLKTRGTLGEEILFVEIMSKAAGALSQMQFETVNGGATY